MIYILLGKSSSGKDSIYKRLLSDLNLKPIIPYTTRPMRENEQNGREYYFVTREMFYDMQNTGDVIEYRIYNTIYGEWIYFTGKIDLNTDCLGISTLEGYMKIKEYYGDIVVPIYIEVEDGLRLSRALERERLDTKPKYAEMCRRFLADIKDFSEENIKLAGIEKRFSNIDIEDCINQIKDYIK